MSKFAHCEENLKIVKIRHTVGAVDPPLHQRLNTFVSTMFP